MVNNLGQFRKPYLMSLAVGGILLTPINVGAALDSHPDQNLSVQAPYDLGEKEQSLSPEAAGDYDTHCHKIKNFEGILKDGKLIQKNFPGETKVAVDKGMLGICFYFPGDTDHNKHWQFSLLGPANIWEQGQHEIKPNDVISCNRAGPCK